MADEPPSEGTPTGVTRRQLREARRQRELLGESAQIDPALDQFISPGAAESRTTPAIPAGNVDASAPRLPRPRAESSQPTHRTDTTGGYGAAPPPGRAAGVGMPLGLGQAGVDASEDTSQDDATASPEALTRRALMGATPDVVASPQTQPEDHPPAWWRRFLPALLAVLALGLLAVVLWFLSDRLGAGESQEPGTSATQTDGGIGDPTVEGPLNGVLPAEVRGGEYSTEGASGSLYTLPPSGYQVDTGAPDEATSAYQAQFLGGALPVTLTAWSFEDADAASAAADAVVADLGEPADTGVVFPTWSRAPTGSSTATVWCRSSGTTARPTSTA